MSDTDEEKAERAAEAKPAQKEDPDAPGTSVDDYSSDEAVEPNEPA